MPEETSNAKVTLALLGQQVGELEKDVKSILEKCGTHHDGFHKQNERLGIIEKAQERAGDDVQILFNKVKGREDVGRSARFRQHAPMIGGSAGGVFALYEIIKLIEKESLQDVVFLVGYKKNASSLLKAFDVFTLTSRTEAFPYVPLEAGLAELPVIASRVGGIPEIVSKDCGILVKRGNINEIAQAITHLLNNKEKRKSLGLNLKKHVQQNFSTQEMVKNTLKYYNKLI